MKIPEDFIHGELGHKERSQARQIEEDYTSDALAWSLVVAFERIATLTEQLEETRNNLRQMTECRDDLNRLVAQRDQELAQARAELDSECAIVNRIWAIFGTPSYEELAGKSIYDLINGVIAERDALRAQLEQMRRPVTDEEWTRRYWTKDEGSGFVGSPLAARARRQEKTEEEVSNG